MLCQYRLKVQSIHLYLVGVSSGSHRMFRFWSWDRLGEAHGAVGRRITEKLTGNNRAVWPSGI